MSEGLCGGASGRGDSGGGGSGAITGSGGSGAATSSAGSHSTGVGALRWIFMLSKEAAGAGPAFVGMCGSRAASALSWICGIVTINPRLHAATSVQPPYSLWPRHHPVMSYEARPVGTGQLGNSSSSSAIQAYSSRAALGATWSR